MMHAQSEWSSRIGSSRNTAGEVQEFSLYFQSDQELVDHRNLFFDWMQKDIQNHTNKNRCSIFN